MSFLEDPGAFWRLNRPKVLPIALLAALLITSARIPAEAAYASEGCGIFADGRLLYTMDSQEEAEAFLAGVKDHYRLSGAKTVNMQFEETIALEPCLEETGERLTAEEGLALYFAQARPALTLRSTQEFSYCADLGAAHVPLTLNSKVLAGEGEALRAYSILLRMTNGKVDERYLIQRGLLLRADREERCKGASFLEEEAIEVQMTFVPPVGLNVTSPYGQPRSETGFHQGVDFYHPQGTPIVAAADGTVATVSQGGSYGRLIVLDHGAGVTTYYAHCNAVYVEAGQQVTAGQRIATLGTTGRTTGPNLHFELRLDGRTLDPMDYF